MTTDTALDVVGLEAFHGYAQALFGIDLQVRSGETVGLLGRNGAGKSTTFRSILGLGVTRRGTIRFEGDDISRSSCETIARRGIAWVPEDRRIFTALTVMENLQLAASITPDGVVPLDDLIDTLPLIEPLLQRRGNQLSGGEQQAVSIARALAARPRVLLLDEPTEGLAPVVVDTLEPAIASLPERFGVSVLVAEQNLAFVLRLAQRVYVLETGRMVHHGSSEEFAASPDLQHRFLSVTAARRRSPDRE